MPPILEPDPTDARRFVIAAVLSKAGQHVGRLAIPLVAVTALQASPGDTGLLAAASTVAFLLIGLPAGVWLDRVRRRPVMIAADLARAVLLLSVPAAWALGALSLPQLFVVVLLVGAGTVLFDVGAQAHLPHVVGRERLVATNARLASIDSVGQVAGPAAGGWLVQLLGAPLVVAVHAAGYLWSAWWLTRLRRPEPPPPPATGGVAAEIRAGLALVLHHPVLRATLAAGALTNLAVAASLAMVPIVLTRDLGASAAVLGAWLAAGGVGGLLGAVAARPVSRRVGEGRSLWLAGLAVAPAAVLTPLIGDPVPVAVAAAGWGVLCAKIGYDNVLLVSFRQAVTPDGALGRVGATARVVLIGAVTAGSLLAGRSASSRARAPRSGPRRPSSRWCGSRCSPRRCAAPARSTRAARP
ncbi:MFS transporter [Pseudonocardia nigra]|uniref:MFS transporter n=1 Tax=Pseudonocardia nigra TaxID=1921578 RepID=UPI001C5FBE95|nr:MFS transporter [Pseudonocardia nigra]